MKRSNDGGRALQYPSFGLPPYTLSGDPSDNGIGFGTNNTQPLKFIPIPYENPDTVQSLQPGVALFVMRSNPDDYHPRKANEAALFTLPMLNSMLAHSRSGYAKADIHNFAFAGIIKANETLKGIEEISDIGLVTTIEGDVPTKYLWSPDLRQFNKLYFVAQKMKRSECGDFMLSTSGIGRSSLPSYPADLGPNDLVWQVRPWPSMEDTKANGINYNRPSWDDHASTIKEYVKDNGNNIEIQKEEPGVVFYVGRVNESVGPEGVGCTIPTEVARTSVRDHLTAKSVTVNVSARRSF